MNMCLTFEYTTVSAEAIQQPKILLKKKQGKAVPNSFMATIFTVSTPRLIQSISRDVRYMSVLPLLKTPLPAGMETSGRRAYR